MTMGVTTTGNVADADPATRAAPLRTLADRVRQVALFEVFGLVLITPGFSWASGTPLLDSVGLLAVLALVAALWNGLYCTAFDRLEWRLARRQADRRPTVWRIVHALGFEGGLLVLTLPIIVAWTGLAWWPALVADIGLALTYTAYAYLFNLAYDRVFPIPAPRAADTAVSAHPADPDAAPAASASDTP